jgi:peptidoglycan/xylan/chitin deacetylase (PgdA/CDA1 family)
MVLCYHGVTHGRYGATSDPEGLHVRCERFVAQLKYLCRYRHVISLREYLKAAEGNFNIPNYSVVLTFDDGYRNFLTAAAPILAEQRLPCSLFLVIEQIRQDNTVRSMKWSATDDEEYLSWAEVEHLGRGGSIDFGSHGCTHRKLSTLSKCELSHELVQSKFQLSEQTELALPVIAFPYGDYSQAVIEGARQAGYRCALTTDEGSNTLTDRVLRRILIGDDDDMCTFAVRISGLIWWLRPVYKFVQKVLNKVTKSEDEPFPESVH